MRQPTGCGEQNMVKFAPNIYVMKYLETAGELTETLKNTLIKHMKSGTRRPQSVEFAAPSVSPWANITTPVVG